MENKRFPGSYADDGFVLEGVGRIKQGKEVLRQISCRMERGQCTAVLGESGSGKTTLLRLLNRMEPFDAGEIFWAGERIEAQESVALRGRVVMLPQQPILWPGSVRKNLLIGRGWISLDAVEEERLYAVLESLSLKVDLQADALSLSGGEKQRVALGRVLLMEPEALLLDEPTSAQDEVTARKIWDVIAREVEQQGRTVVAITHQPQLAKKYCPGYIELREGRVARMGRW